MSHLEAAVNVGNTSALQTVLVPPQTNRRKATTSSATWVAVTIVAAAALIRCWGIGREGLLDWDAAYYLGVVKTVRTVIDWTWQTMVHGHASGSLAQQLLETGVAVNPTAKHGFLALLLLGSLVAGVHEWLSLGLSALAGVLTVCLIGRIGAQLFDVRVGLVAMALLAVSFTHVHYSRSGLPTSMSTFFVCLGWWLYLRSRQAHERRQPSHLRVVGWSGVAIGYAFTCHYNLFWVPPVFLALLLAEVWRDRAHVPPRHRWSRFWRFSLGAVAPFGVFHSLTWLAQQVIVRSPALLRATRGRWGQGRFLTYAEELVLQSAGHGSGFRDPLFYVKLVLAWEGWPVLLMGMAALVWAVWRLRRRDSIPWLSCCLLAGVPLGFWSIVSYPVARLVGVAVPIVSLIIAAWLVAGYDRLRAVREDVARAAALLLGASLCVGGAWHVRPLLRVRSGMPAAVVFMREHGSVKHLSSEFPLSRLYAGRDNVLDMTKGFLRGDPQAVLASAYGEGSRFVLVSGAKFASEPAVLALLDRARPVFTAPHSTHLTAYEYHDPDIRRRILASAEVLELYALQDLLQPAAHPVAPPAPTS